MYPRISILSRLTLEKGVIIFCVSRTFTVIAGRGCILRVQGYRLIVPAFRGIMAWLLTDLAKFASVVVVGGILVLFSSVFSTCDNGVAWESTVSASFTRLLLILRHLILLSVCLILIGGSHNLKKAGAVGYIVLGTAAAETFRLFLIGNCSNRCCFVCVQFGQQ